MKKIIAIICLLFGFTFLSTPDAFAVHVNGYFRSNGTYVNGYERTAPDGNPYNNYSYPGNYNPNTGSITGGNPSSYLDNYYNSSSGSSYSPSYNYSYPKTPTCPSMSIYDSISGSCKCMSGYVVGKDFLGKENCVSVLQKCQDDYGYGSSYSYLTNSCECNYGYIMSGGKCISGSTYCSNKIGLMSRYDSLSKTCECMTGYKFDGFSCVYKKTDYSYTYPSEYTASLTTYCPINSMPSSTNPAKCLCNIGFQKNGTGDGCEIIPPKTCPLSSTLVGQNCVCNVGLVLKNNKCISNTEDCELSFGKNVIGTPGSNNNSNCNCASGYQWNSTKTSCLFISNTAKMQQSINNSSLTAFLQVGASGNQVTALQNVLKKLGIFTSDITGYYGNATRESVILYQKSHSIDPTGTVGPKTRESLNNYSSSQ